MMSSLFSAVSGLKSNQEMMDVIGNNIANVNTPGFKSSQVNFADLLSQTMKGASLPTTTTGGTNPIQIGQGTSTASVDTNFTGGSLQQTGIGTNLGINGDGLFILGSGGNQYYTRDGDFSFDSQGNLVSNANGMYVQGWMPNASGTIDATASPTNLSINLNASAPAQATSVMALSGNLDEQSTTPQNVVVNAYDSLGDQYTVNLQFTEDPTTPGSWDWAATSITDSSGFSDTSGASSGNVTFDSSGVLNSGSPGTITFSPTNGATTPATIALDMSGLTQYSSATTAALKTQNGYTPGTLQSYTIDQTGTITGSFSNGVTTSLGQIALANFPNPGGLQSAGNNTYSASANSGATTIQPAGTGSLGTIKTDSLEMSNVDLSQEMSNMIIAQSGFDANSKVITTDDQLMQTLVNMIQG